MARAITRIIAFVISMGGVNLCAAQSNSEYVLSFTAENRRVIQVEAQLEAAGGVLTMNSGMTAEQLPRGFATFIDQLEVLAAGGSSVAYEPDGRESWRLAQNANGPIRLRYRVNLAHEELEWPFGLDEAVFVTEDCIFFATRAVFILGDRVSAATVRFNTPAEWNVSAPWPRVDGEARAFVSGIASPLVPNCAAVGTHLERRIEAGPHGVVLAAGGPLKAYADSFDTEIRTSLASFEALFGAPIDRPLLIVLNAPFTTAINGGAYPNSISMIAPPRLLERSRWRMVVDLCHEILHMWNGNALRPAEQAEWFKEGFTEYFTWLCLRRAGIVDMETFLLRGIAANLGAYYNALQGTPVAVAGDEKASNFELVYGGGFAVAFALDVLIFEATSGNRSLDNFMRAMLAAFGHGSNGYRVADIERIAGEIAGRDLTPFFAAHVHGAERLDVADYLRRAGFAAESTESGGRTTFRLRTVEESDGLPRRFFAHLTGE